MSAALQDRLIRLAESTKRRLHCHCVNCYSAIDNFNISALAVLNAFLATDRADHSYTRGIGDFADEEACEYEYVYEDMEEENDSGGNPDWSPGAFGEEELDSDLPHEVITFSDDSSMSGTFPCAKRNAPPTNNRQVNFMSKRLRSSAHTNSSESNAQEESKDLKKVEVVNLRCIVVNCGKEVANRDLLNDHLKRVHKVQKYRCMIKNCGRSFSLRNQLRQHVTTEHGTLTKFPCAFCSSRVKTYNQLTYHYTVSHEIGTFRCTAPKCSFTSTTIRRMVTNHYQSTHQTTQCKVCGKICKPTRMVTHMQSHRPEKPFRCGTCERAFARKPQLVVHEMTCRLKLEKVFWQI